MSSERSNRELLDAWKGGDQEAANLIYRRYQTRLCSLVRSRLSRKLSRRVDPEDILLSTYRSFFVGVQNGRITPCENDDLWPILTTIAMRKLIRQSRFNQAERRSVDAERQDESCLLEAMATDEPTAEHAAIMVDEIENVLSRLDGTSREVFVRTLQGQDIQWIANELNLNERSVRRAMQRIRQQLPTTTIGLSPFQGLSLVADRILRAQHRVATLKEGMMNYGNYLLKRFVGAGAFSKVYEALERDSGRIVAIKYLKKECLPDERAVNSLLREYDILRQLKHPGILAVHGWGTTPGGSLFLVTDLIEGGDLISWSSRVKPNIRQILTLIFEIATAIAAAHAGHIIHGDLKPGNILVNAGEQVILCDFGLSRHATDPDDVPRGGTAGFLAPEQISDAFGPVTMLTDVYGLGGIFYAVVTERPPMAGRDLPEVMSNVLSQRMPEAPLQTEDIISRQINDMILKCLQKEPQNRFQSIQEVLLALQNLISS